jgi:hypothetical protein
MWMDLRAEPVVLSVPAVDPKRYYSVMLCDQNTYNYGYIGSRATGSDAGDYMVAGPEWKGATPPDIKKVFQPFQGRLWVKGGYRREVDRPSASPPIADLVALSEQFRKVPTTDFTYRPLKENPSSGRAGFDRCLGLLSEYIFKRSLSASVRTDPSRSLGLLWQGAMRRPRIRFVPPDERH